MPGTYVAKQGCAPTTVAHERACATVKFSHAPPAIREPPPDGRPSPLPTRSYTSPRSQRRLDLVQILCSVAGTHRVERAGWIGRIGSCSQIGWQRGDGRIGTSTHMDHSPIRHSSSTKMGAGWLVDMAFNLATPFDSRSANGMSPSDCAGGCAGGVQHYRERNGDSPSIHVDLRHRINKGPVLLQYQ